MPKKCLVVSIAILFIGLLFVPTVNVLGVGIEQTIDPPVINDILIEYTDISVEEAWTLLNDTSNGIQIPIDVRFDYEWIVEHIDTPAPENPRHHCVCEWSNVTILQEFISLYDGEEIIIYCLSGGRSLMAAEILVENNFSGTIYNMLGGITAWNEAGFPTIANQPPGAPDITGPINGKAGEEQEYTIVSTDPDGDDIYYYINWSDGTNTIYIGPYESDEEVSISHTWEEKGTYIIKVKAWDYYQAESEWGTLEVSMPKDMRSDLLSQLFEKLTQKYPILNNFFFQQTPAHLIYGTATYSDGYSTAGALVDVMSSLGTLSTSVYSGGNWQVDCGDPGPNWPDGTAFTVYVTGCCGHRGWSGESSGIVSGGYNDMGNIVTYPNSNPNAPSIPNGPIAIHVGDSGTYATNATDPNDLHEIKYKFDWDAEGSHDYSNFTEFVDNGMPASKSHFWGVPGTYVVKAQAKDEYGYESDWSEGFTVIVYEDNTPPEVPVIDGPTSGKKENECTYNITTRDSDGDVVKYFVDWGDGNTTDWIGPYESGETISIDYKWACKGTYEIRVKAKDIYEVESGWSEPHTMHITAPEIKIDGIYGGLFKIHLDISNVGDGIATDVDWNILLSGGLLISGENTSGAIKDMAPGNHITVTSDLIFGISTNTIVSVYANIEGGNIDTMEKEASILFFFILM